MAELNINKASITDFNNMTDLSYTVDSISLDSPNGSQEVEWTFPDASQNMGYYKTLPELKIPIDILALWTVGTGFTANDADKPIIENITGWGEDSFLSILWGLIVGKKILGDSFAEIIRNDKGTLINLKPLNTEHMKTVVGKNGLIKRYEHSVKGEWIKLEKHEVLHLCNGRIGDEVHGVSVAEVCKWVMLAKNEAMDVYRKIFKRSLAMGILYVDSDDQVEINRIMTKYQNAVKNCEVLVLPDKVARIEDSKISIQDFLSWIKYLENFSYQAVGVPRVMATSEGYTEAGGKVGFLTFQPIYTWEQVQLEADLWNQVGIKITFNRPPSLMDNMQSDEAKNTGQTSIQPKEASINMERE